MQPIHLEEQITTASVTKTGNSHSATNSQFTGLQATKIHLKGNRKINAEIFRNLNSEILTLIENQVRHHIWGGLLGNRRPNWCGIEYMKPYGGMAKENQFPLPSKAALPIKIWHACSPSRTYKIAWSKKSPMHQWLVWIEYQYKDIWGSFNLQVDVLCNGI